MRYYDIEETVFEPGDGREVLIKVSRSIPEYSLWFTLKTLDGDRLDEIATRSNVYGRKSELNAYTLFDFNIVEIVDNGFAIEGMQTLRVPTR